MALNSLFVFWALEDGVDENAGRMNLIGVELAEFNEFFDLGNDVVRGGSHHRIEVASGLAIDEIAPTIAFPSFDKREIPAQGALENVLAAVEFARFFSFTNHPALSPGCGDPSNAGATGAQAFAQRALRIQFHL